MTVELWRASTNNRDLQTEEKEKDNRDETEGNWVEMVSHMSDFIREFRVVAGGSH